MRVALVVMPFATGDRPSLAAGLLKALLAERGIACDCKYFNLTFCSLLGREAYQRLSISSLTHVLAGEWIFSQIYFGEAFSDWERYDREVLDHSVLNVPQDYRDLVRQAKTLAPTLLRLAYESCDWSGYDLVGFTSTFEQTLPSMCLARMIRRGHPGIKIAVGGANFEGPMGRPYLDLFPEVDFVSSGEADASFPQLCENLAAGVATVPPGILSRNGSSNGNGAAPPAPKPLDSLPLPDYDDFYPAFARTFPGADPPFLTLEASRGCWWGQKHHCTFCGLNGATMTFRRKSWQRVAREASELAARYRPSCLVFADNILAMEFFSTLLPQWAEEGSRTEKFFEIKSNLKREQVALLQRAGVLHVQSGVESLSDHTLQLMDKGVSAAQNIALLRWCRELGIHAQWNLIFGFPGEDLDDYPRMDELLQKLAHLHAPEVCSLIRMDRFSPNFERWQEKGFLEIRPLPAYRHVYPLDDESLRSLAYFFDSRHAQSDCVVELARGIIEFGNGWRERQAGDGAGTFAVRRHLDGGWVLVDTRFNRPRAAERLAARDLLLLHLGDAPTTRDALFERAESLSGWTRQEISRSYDALVKREAICQVGDRVVTLPLLPDEMRAAPLLAEKER